jgi:hypothetical protein
MQAYQRLGIPTDLAGDVTGNRGLQYMQNIAAGKPGSDSVVAQASQDAVNGWKAALDRTALKLGKATTAQEAGASLVNASQDWLDQFKKQGNDLWSNFKLQVPGTTQVPAPAFQNALGSINQEWGGAEGLAKVLQPKLAQQLEDARAQDISPTGTLPWQALQATRSRLGEMLSSPDPIADTGKAAIKQIYGALSQDMRNGAASVSPDALAAFDKANAYTAAGHQILDNHLAPIIQAGKNGTPEKAAQAALAQVRLGGSNVDALGQAIPQGAGDLASYQLHNLAGGEQSPVSFATALGGKRPAMSPEARQAMFGPVAQNVADLQTAGQAMKDTAAIANHSNTAAYVARDPAIRGLAAIEAARQGHAVAGLPGAVAAGMGTYFGPLLAGRAAQAMAVNPAMSRLYSYAPLAEFHTPNVSVRLPIAGRLQMPFSPAPMAVMAAGRTNTPTP